MKRDPQRDLVIGLAKSSFGELSPVLAPSECSTVRLLDRFGADHLIPHAPELDSGHYVSVDEWPFSQSSSGDKSMDTPEKKKGKGSLLASSYVIKRNSFFLKKVFVNGEKQIAEYTRLTNFTARIIREYDVTDGQKSIKSFDLEIKRRRNAAPFVVHVSADDFGNLKAWVIPRLGGKFIVYPGWQHEDMVRTAIQECSGEPPVMTVYLHTGWIKLNGEDYFLHAGGAIGKNSWGEQPDTDRPTPNPFETQEFGDLGAIGAILGVKVGNSHIGVQYGDVLSKFRLPAPPRGEYLRKCIRASLKMLDVAPDTVTFPLYAAVWRAPIGGSTFTIYLDGTTGSGKSVMAALAQQHFGAVMHYENLPLHWSGTANGLEGMTFLLKDVLYVIDDWLTRGTQSDAQRANRDADRVLRAQGNHSGRLRSNRDGTPMAPRPPRGQLVSTGESMPEGQSVNARCLRIEVMTDIIMAPSNLVKVTDAQKDGDAGLYAAAMAGYIAWMSNDVTEVRADFDTDKEGIRKQLRAGCKHPRTASIVAELAAGFNTFLEFALAADAIDEVEHDQLQERFGAALRIQIKEQGQNLETADPVTQFCEYLAAALLTGRAYVETFVGKHPENAPTAWGWKKKVWRKPKEDTKNSDKSRPNEQAQSNEQAQGNGQASTDGQAQSNGQPQVDGRAKADGKTQADEEVQVNNQPANQTTQSETDNEHDYEYVDFFEARGTKIGWIESDQLYLIPAAAFKAAQEYAASCNQHLIVTPRVLGRLLDARGLLVARDKQRGNRFTRRINVEKSRIEVYHLDASTIIPPEFHGQPWEESGYDGPSLEELIEDEKRKGKPWVDLLLD